MLDYPKLELKKGGAVKYRVINGKKIPIPNRNIKKKQIKQVPKNDYSLQRQHQIVNVNLGARDVKRSYTRRQQQQPQKNMMYYPPPMTTIIQNPNQPQQLPDMISLLNLLNSQGMKAPQQKTINELRLENLEKQQINKTSAEQLKNLNEEKKPFTPEEEEEYYNNFLDDDFRNVNIMNVPIGNPLVDNNKLPSLSLNSDSLSPPSPPPQEEKKEIEFKTPTKGDLNQLINKLGSSGIKKTVEEGSNPYKSSYKNFYVFSLVKNYGYPIESTLKYNVNELKDLLTKEQQKKKLEG